MKEKTSALIAGNIYYYNESMTKIMVQDGVFNETVSAMNYAAYCHYDKSLHRRYCFGLITKNEYREILNSTIINAKFLSGYTRYYHCNSKDLLHLNKIRSILISTGQFTEYEIVSTEIDRKPNAISLLLFKIFPFLWP